MSSFYPRSSTSPGSGGYYGGGGHTHRYGATPGREGSAGLYDDHSPQPLAPPSDAHMFDGESHSEQYLPIQPTSTTDTSYQGGGGYSSNLESPPPRIPSSSSHMPTATTNPPLPLPLVPSHRHPSDTDSLSATREYTTSSSSALASHNKPVATTSGLVRTASSPAATSVNTTKHYWDLRRAEALVQEVSRRNDHLTKQRQGVEDLKRRARAKLQGMTDLSIARRREAIVATDQYRAEEGTRHLLQSMAVKGSGSWWSPSPTSLSSSPSYWESADKLFSFVQANPHLLLPPPAPPVHSPPTPHHSDTLGGLMPPRSAGGGKGLLMAPAPSSSPSPPPPTSHHHQNSNQQYGVSSDGDDDSPYTLRDHAAYLRNTSILSSVHSPTPKVPPTRPATTDVTDSDPTYLHDRYSALLQQASQLDMRERRSIGSLGPSRSSMRR